MSILSQLLALLLALPGLITHPPTEWKPDRPNKLTESTFSAPRGVITNLGYSRSLLTLPDGREYVISEQPPGHYIDIRVEDRDFKRGTLLFK